MRNSQRGYMGFFMLVILGAAAMYFYFYVKGPGGKPLIQEELDAIGQAKEIQNIQNKRNQEIDQAMKDY